MALLHKLRQWRRAVSDYQPFVKIFISRSAIGHNFKAYQESLPKLAVAPVLKSNAYGHGLIEVAQIVDEFNPPFIAVDSLFEARVLRQAGIRAQLLVIGYSLPGNVNANRNDDTVFTVVGIEHLRELVNIIAWPTKVHVKFDTGMHRQGLMPNEIDEVVSLLGKNENIKVDGIFTHLCDADGKDDEFTLGQLDVWEKVVKIWNEKFGEVRWQHVSATKGVRFAEQASCNAIRLGIGLYGGTKPIIINTSLQLAMKMETIVSSVRTIPAGDYVGYNITHRAEKTTRVATVPVGYFEGVDRRLSNKGSMLINGVPCKILGRVSMNITTVDVTDVDCQAGDKVVVISDNVGDENSIFKMAELADTIPYEILIHVPQHLRRDVIG